MHVHTANLLGAVPQQMLCIRTFPLPPCNSPAEHQISEQETAATIEMVMRRLSLETEANELKLHSVDSQQLIIAKPEEAKKSSRMLGMRLGLGSIENAELKNSRTG